MRDRLPGKAGAPHRRINPTNRRPNPVDVHVGRRLRLCRTLMGLSQRNLGEILGLTFQQVQKYEQGLNRIGAGLLYQFACALKVPVEYFFDDISTDMKACRPGSILTGTMPDGWFGADSAIIDREVLEIVRAFKAIRSPKLRREVCGLADALGAGAGRRTQPPGDLAAHD